ncbi:hypothetical protein ACLOJK_004867, partial [Asimina triloba]
MAPKKAMDKGKAPMRDDDEQWTTGMEDMRRGIRETEQRTVPTVEPQAEQRAGEMQGIETAQTEGNDRGHRQAGTSVQLMMGMLRQIIETMSQPRASTGPDPSTVPGARAEVSVQRPGREDVDVE